MEQGKSRLAQEFEKKEEGRLVRLNKYISGSRSLLQKRSRPAD